MGTMRLLRFLKRTQSSKERPAETKETGSLLLDLPDGVFYAILEQLPGNEPLRLIGVSRSLRALVLGCPVVHASLGVSCREGEGIVAKRWPPQCPTRSFLRFLQGGGAGMLASLTIVVKDAVGGLLSTTSVVTASAWEPLSALRTLSLSLPRNLSRDSADNVLRACTSLRTLGLQFPAGSVDTAYLAHHAERCASLQLLEVTAQRMLFTKNLDGGGGSVSGGAGRRRPLRLVVRVQELALYGGGRPALTAGIDEVELHVEKMIYFEGAPAMRRLLGSGDRLSLHCASDDVFHSFGDRRHIIGADIVEEEELMLEVMPMCKPLTLTHPGLDSSVRSCDRPL